MSKIKSDVTACILSYNRPEFIVDAIKSVLALNLQPVKIIIFDNGSHSAVYNRVKKFFKYGIQWKGSSNSNDVFWNFNRAINSLDTKYVFLLHDDDKVCPNYLDEQINILDSDINISAVSCNGFIIESNGKRNGNLVIPEDLNCKVHLFNNSGDVALRYARDICIPFSPTLYRSKIFKKIKLKKSYGQFSDVALFSDIADSGILAFQNSPLYECRIHEKQDSFMTTNETSLRLEKYLTSRKFDDLNDLKVLKKLLRYQYTSHSLRFLARYIHKFEFKKLIIDSLKKIRNNKFSFFGAIKIFTFFLLKKINSYLNKLI